jgi:uncharacterized glyoxalase superfamily protein PhnB
MSDAAGAAEFYKHALGATELARMVAPGDAQGRLIHVHLIINGGSLMLSDAFPENGHPARAHDSFGLTLQVKDLDSWWERAVAAGAEVIMPAQKMFWGDRYGQLKDPYGVTWAFNEPG